MLKLRSQVDARLPDAYISNVSLRMEIYQRFGDAMTLADVDELWNEVKDRYGKPQEPALWLYHMTRLKVFAQSHGFTLIKMEKFSLRTERLKGKQTLSNQSLIPRFKQPKDISEKIIPILQKQLA